MLIQDFLTENKLVVDKAVIGSPVHMSDTENVELSTIDALMPDGFVIGEGEYSPDYVAAIKNGRIVAYVFVS